MLRKLLKHEFAATSRVIPFTYLALLASFILMCVFVLTGVRGTVVEIIATMLNTFTLMASYMIVIVTAVLLVVRYYRSMYGSESYLTHSIPVKGHTLVLTKAFVSFVWIICSVVVCVISLLSFIWTFSNIFGADLSFGDYFSEISEAYSAVISDESIAGTVIWTIIGFITSVIMSIGMVTFSVSLGSCSKLQKLGIGAPILIYFGCSLVLSIISMIVTVYSSEHYFVMYSLQENYSSFAIQTPLVITSIFSLVVGALFIGLSCYIVDKHTSLK